MISFDPIQYNHIETYYRLMRVYPCNYFWEQTVPKIGNSPHVLCTRLEWKREGNHLGIRERGYVIRSDGGRGKQKWIYVRGFLIVILFDVSCCLL